MRAAGFGLSGRLGELALAVAQQEQVSPGPAQPEIEAAIVVDVAQAGNNRLVGQARPGLEVALAIVEEHHGPAKGADPRQHHVLVAVGIDIPDRDPWNVHLATRPCPGRERAIDVLDIRREQHARRGEHGGRRNRQAVRRERCEVLAPARVGFDHSP